MTLASASKFAIALSLFPAVAIAVTQDVSYDFSAMPHVNDKATYHQQAKFTISGQDIDYSSDEAQTVLKVGADGSETVKAVDTNTVVSAGGNPLPSPPSAPSTTDSDGLGHVLKITSDQPTPAEAYRLADLTAFVHNASDKTSGGWTTRVPADAKTGAVPYVATYKVSGMEKIGSWDTYKIIFSVKETGPDPKASSDGTMWICKDTGWPAKIVANLHNAPLPGVPTPIEGTMTVTRTS